MKIWVVYGSDIYDGTMYAAKYFLSFEKAMRYLAELKETSSYTWCDCDEIEVQE